MAYLTTGPSKGNRRPTVAVPGSKGSSRPTAQKGGGGNKAAGSVEPTAANTPTVSVHSDGSVTAEHFSPKEAGKAAAEVARQRAAEAHVKRVVALVNSKPDRKPVVAKGTEPRKPEAKTSMPTFTAAEKKVLETGKPLSKFEAKADAAALKPVTVSAHTRKAPESKLKGTQQERKAARANVRQAKKAVRASRTPASVRIGEIETPEQAKNLRTVLRTGKKMGASKKELLAATETGLVESYGFKNIKGGDADSEGWRQERRMYYPEPTNVKAGAKNFFDEAKTDPSIPGGGGETAGELAQTVQGSAFPERYDEHKAEAAAILKAFSGSQASPKAVKDLAAAKKEARELGLKVGGKGVGKPPAKLVRRTVAAEKAMREIEGTPYLLGGGHGAPHSEPTMGGYEDCSGAVGYVLNKVGALKGSAVSGEMGKYLQPGPGALTVFYNAGHTFLRLINRKGESEYWGTSVGDSGAGGLTRHPTPSASYLAEYSVGHVPGMGKLQALQMGAEPGSLSGGSPSSFPGMTVSSSGTTATIESGAGSTQTKPGFSKTPIRSLSAPQRIRQVEATLKAGDLAAGKGAEAASTSTLDALSKKYGSAA